MTKRSKLAIVATTAVLLALAPTVAFAGKSGGSNSGPKESVGFNYGKTEHTYTEQKASGKKSTAGKVKFNEFTIKKTTDKASP